MAPQNAVSDVKANGGKVAAAELDLSVPLATEPTEEEKVCQFFGITAEKWATYDVNVRAMLVGKVAGKDDAQKITQFVVAAAGKTDNLIVDSILLIARHGDTIGSMMPQKMNKKGDMVPCTRADYIASLPLSIGSKWLIDRASNTDKNLWCVKRLANRTMSSFEAKEAFALQSKMTKLGESAAAFAAKLDMILAQPGHRAAIVAANKEYAEKVGLLKPPSEVAKPQPIAKFLVDMEFAKLLGIEQQIVSSKMATAVHALQFTGQTELTAAEDLAIRKDAEAAFAKEYPVVAARLSELRGSRK